MPLPIKTYFPSLALFTRKLCKYILRHQGKILTLMDDIITNPADRTVIVAMFSAVSAGCAVLDTYFPE